MYKIDDVTIYSFKKALKKYKEKNKSNKKLNSLLELLLDQLKENPRDVTKCKIHPLHGKMKGFWSADTKLNSGSDRLIYTVCDDTNTVFLYDIGDHTMYESYEEKITLRTLFKDILG